MKRLILPVLLVLVAVGCAVAALKLDDQAAEAAPAGDEVVSPVTPVLSARRVPDLVSRSGADARLRAGLDGLVGALPPESCLVVKADGRPIVAHRPTDPVTPASTEKVLTAAAALSVLDPGMRFRTTVEAASAPQAGVVAGNLYLVGGGDPVLTTDAYADSSDKQKLAHTRLEDLADAVVDAGVTRIEGRVLGDESRYSSARYVDAWPSRFIDQNQTGPLSALSVNDGYESFPRADDPGAPLRPSADPPTRAAAVFTVLLKQRGVEVVGAPGAGTAPNDSVEIAGKNSKKLKRILAEFLHYSDNQTAELVLREIGHTASGDGTTEAGAAAVEAALADAGLPTDGQDTIDGSGLSDGTGPGGPNRLTCALLVGALDHTPGLVGDLAVGGEPGTLASFAGTPLEGRLHGKSGTLNDVRALTGIVDLTEGGERLTFAYIINNPPYITPDQDALRGQLGALLASYPDRPPLEDLIPVAVPGQAGG